jgi:hypothetical protein
MADEPDQVFTRDVFNASLTLMSILVVVITFLAVEYKVPRADPIFARPIRIAIIGTTVASVLSGTIALVALAQLRLRRWSADLLAAAFGILISMMTLGLVVYVLCVLQV